MEDVRYQILNVRMRKNVRGFGLSITGGSTAGSPVPQSCLPSGDPHPLCRKDDDGCCNQKEEELGGSSNNNNNLIRMMGTLIRIRAIYPSEPAADAGLRPGDFLLQANDQSMITMTSVVS